MYSRASSKNDTLRIHFFHLHLEHRNTYPSLRDLSLIINIQRRQLRREQYCVRFIHAPFLLARDGLRESMTDNFSPSLFSEREKCDHGFDIREDNGSRNLASNLTLYDNCNIIVVISKQNRNPFRHC